jgi:hypothetical protein
VRDVVLQFLYFGLFVLRQVMCGHYAIYDYRNVNDIKGNTDLVDEIVLQKVSHTNYIVIARCSNSAVARVLDGLRTGTVGSG